MRLEPELWDALYEVCARERVSVANLVERIEHGRSSGGRTSAVRVHLVTYYRAAATEEGHALAGHGARMGDGGWRHASGGEG